MDNLSQTRTLAALDNTNNVFCNDEVAVRVIHYWDARNYKKGHMLMGRELLLLDSQSTAVQGFISARLLHHFQNQIVAGKAYIIRRFMLKPARDRFKVADNKHTIIFTDQTTAVENPEDGYVIPKERFRIRLFQEFSAVVDTDVDLFDVLGQIMFITGVGGSNDAGTSNNCVTVHLRLKDGETIRAYLWSNVASQVRQRWKESKTHPTTHLLTTFNSRTLGGVVSLKTTAASRVFFDTDVDETKAMVAWVAQGCPGMPTVTTSSVVTKMETATVDELHQFLQTANPLTFEKAGYIVYATIVGVPDSCKWNYISCSMCPTQLVQRGTSLYCPKCKETNNIVLTKYRFEVTVRDTAGEKATFVIFEREGTQILGKTAADLLQAEGEGETNGTTPALLKTIVGSSWEFQIQVAKYNLTAARQTFTVTKMVEKGHENVNIDKDGHDKQDAGPQGKQAAKKRCLQT